MTLQHRGHFRSRVALMGGFNDAKIVFHIHVGQDTAFGLYMFPPVCFFSLTEMTLNIMHYVKQFDRHSRPPWHFDGQIWKTVQGFHRARRLFLK